MKYRTPSYYNVSKGGFTREYGRRWVLDVELFPRTKTWVQVFVSRPERAGHVTDRTDTSLTSQWPQAVPHVALSFPSFNSNSIISPPSLTQSGSELSFRHLSMV